MITPLSEQLEDENDQGNGCYGDKQEPFLPQKIQHDIPQGSHIGFRIFDPYSKNQALKSRN